MTAAVENRLLPLRDFYHHDCDSSVRLKSDLLPLICFAVKCNRFHFVPCIVPQMMINETHSFFTQPFV